MSADAFGNSPAMTEAEMIAAGLLDESGELTEYGRAQLDAAEALDLDECDPFCKHNRDA